MNGKILFAVAVAFAWLGCSGSSSSTTTTASGGNNSAATSSTGSHGSTTGAAGTTGTASTTTSGAVGTTIGVSGTAASGTAATGTTSSSGSTSGTTGTLVLCPSVATLLPNDKLTFSIPGTSGVTWGTPEGGTIDASGNFVAPTMPGMYTVTASAGGQTGTANITVVNDVPAISGTITYTGSKAGVVYIVLSGNDGNGQSTAIFAPGTFEIRNPSIQNGSFTVQAFMDVLDEAAPNAAADPMGSASSTWSGTSVTGLSITLTDPVPQTPPAPSSPPQVFPGNGQVVALWGPLTDNSGNEIADHYKVYMNSTASATGATSQTFVAGENPDVGILNATNGSTQYFAYSAIDNGTEGPLSAFTDGIAIGTPIGGSTLTGTVDLTALTPTGPLYVIAFTGTQGPTTLFFTSIDSPSGMQAYSISGLPNGDYNVGYVLNQTNGAPFGPGNPSSLNRGNGIPVTVSGATTAPTITVSGAAAIATAVTQTSLCGPGCVSYGVQLSVDGNLKQIVSAVLAASVSETPFVPPQELGMQGGGVFQVSNGDSTPTTVGTSIPVNVTYADQTTCTVSGQITGVLTSTPTPTAPIGTGITEPVTFTWTAPATPPSGTYTYGMYAEPFQAGGGNNSDTYQFNGPSTVTSTQAPTGTFTSGQEYQWQVYITDQYGNQASGNSVTFTMQ